MIVQRADLAFFGSRLSFMLWRNLENPQLHLEKYATSIQSGLLGGNKLPRFDWQPAVKSLGDLKRGGVNGWSQRVDRRIVQGFWSV
jgi:hypothetical protein